MSMSEQQTELQKAFAVVRSAEEKVLAAINAWCDEPRGPAHPWEVQIASASVLDVQASSDDQAVTLMVDWGDNSGESPEDTEEKLRPLLRELGIERVWVKRLIDMPVDVPPAEGWPTAIRRWDGVGRYDGQIEVGMTFECIGEAGHDHMRSCKWEEANGPQEFARQGAMATCTDWCGLSHADPRVPSGWNGDGGDTDCVGWSGDCRIPGCQHIVRCTQACLDMAKAAKGKQDGAKCFCGSSGRRMRLNDSGRRCVRVLCPAHTDGIEAPWAAEEDAANAVSCRGVMCIRSECKAPPVAGGELCAAHAGQVEAVKAKCCAWKNGVSACGRPSVGGRLCTKHEAELRASDAKPSPPPTETRLERWRREHKGYSHDAMDQRLHDANVAAMMVGIDGPREAYVPAPKPDPWTPRDLDGDIPDAWEPGGARLGGTR